MYGTYETFNLTFLSVSHHCHHQFMVHQRRLCFEDDVLDVTMVKVQIVCKSVSFLQKYFMCGDYICSSVCAVSVQHKHKYNYVTQGFTCIPRAWQNTIIIIHHVAVVMYLFTSVKSFEIRLFKLKIKSHVVESRVLQCRAVFFGINF